MLPIENSRLANLKPSFATRRVRTESLAYLDEDATNLTAGDLVIARVRTIGQHQRIERPDGRKAMLFPGDEILLACGARYAPDQFEAEVPAAVGPASMVAAGGIAGIVQSQNVRMRQATGITILGAVHDASGTRVNLRDYAIAGNNAPGALPVIAVCGTSMNAGKTHTVASLVHGFALSGKKVAAIKVTGTGSGGDLWFYKDSGAHFIADFTDAGLASTYKVGIDTIIDATRNLIAAAQNSGAEAIVMEVADGLHQLETSGLMRSDRFRSLLDGVIFAATDAMGAHAGVDWLQRAGHQVKAVSGVLTKAPLAVQECRSAVDLPCFTPTDLYNSETVDWLLDQTGRATLPSAA